MNSAVAPAGSPLSDSRLGARAVVRRSPISTVARSPAVTLTARGETPTWRTDTRARRRRTPLASLTHTTIGNVPRTERREVVIVSVADDDVRDSDVRD
ncbi:MAG: hypothetical protein ACRDMZ_22545, partial [Solirubrobacteraceae bacterium]